MASGSLRKQTKQVELCKWKKKVISCRLYLGSLDGGDLDLGGSPQVLNARGITLAAPKQPLRRAIQSS